MKRTSLSVALFFIFAPIALTIALLFSGCMTDPATGKRHLDIFRTSTNDAGNVVVEVSPSVRDTIAGVDGVNSAIPTPAQPIVTLGLAGLSALFAAFARRKTILANQKEGEKSEVEAALGAVVRAVEVGPLTDEAKQQLLDIISAGMAAGRSAESILDQVKAIDWSKSLKQSVQTEAIRSGSANIVHNAVKNHTKQ